MPRRAVTTLLLACLALPGVRASAQSVVGRVAADSVSVGERVDLVVAAVHDGSRSPVFPDQTGRPAPPEAIGLAGDFELIGRRSAGTRLLPDGARLDSVVYDATTFRLDSAWVAPVVGFAAAGDTVLSAGPPRLVFVRSVVPEDAQDILDITPIAAFPRTWWPWILLAVLAVAGILFWRLRRSTDEEPEPAPEPVPAEPPIEEAIRRLSALAATDLGNPLAVKPFFVELSDIVRTYVARRIGVPALELTTAEMVTELRALRDTVGLPDDRVRDLDRLLRAADMVKFADHRMPEPEARAALAASSDALRVTEDDLARAVAREAAPMP